MENRLGLKKLKGLSDLEVVELMMKEVNTIYSSVARSWGHVI